MAWAGMRVVSAYSVAATMDRSCSSSSGARGTTAAGCTGFFLALALGWGAPVGCTLKVSRSHRSNVNLSGMPSPTLWYKRHKKRSTDGMARAEGLRPPGPRTLLVPSRRPSLRPSLMRRSLPEPTPTKTRAAWKHTWWPRKVMLYRCLRALCNLRLGLGAGFTGWPTSRRLRWREGSKSESSAGEPEVGEVSHLAGQLSSSLVSLRTSCCSIVVAPFPPGAWPRTRCFPCSVSLSEDVSSRALTSGALLMSLCPGRPNRKARCWSLSASLSKAWSSRRNLRICCSCPSSAV